MLFRTALAIAATSYAQTTEPCQKTPWGDLSVIETSMGEAKWYIGKTLISNDPRLPGSCIHAQVIPPTSSPVIYFHLLQGTSCPGNGIFVSKVGQRFVTSQEVGECYEYENPKVWTKKGITYFQGSPTAPLWILKHGKVQKKK